ncbi:hypothetical protein AMS68_003751 [Peltaster fructicola]|uniref:Mur ligase central domain-containing protein n=1 Tax=Peltaster fructicola TaxID=286661 RepID=A0A6H0XU27_9PEZI|nr:hypothetical protein AMS68_003751 [Peltaster fructicola]
MIQPGLSRISKLLATTELPWRAIHVAGTNGKGSICNYAASMLKVYNNTSLPPFTGHAKLTYGKFTSPHLMDRWDGISVNDAVISKEDFQRIEDKIVRRDRNDAINASEFEILTATAFETFTKAKVDVGIIEVGMGGRLDATNIIGQSTHKDSTSVRATPLVTAISKIGLDHQAFLGNTLTEIAAQKAGIMKPRVPVVYDESNAKEVRDVLEQHAMAVGVKATSMAALGLDPDWSLLPVEERPQGYETHDGYPIHAHIQNNTSVALRSTWLALSQLGRLACPPAMSEADHAQQLRDMAQLMSRVSEAGSTPNRGRLERVRVVRRTASGSIVHKLLADGAHNAQSAIALADEVTLLRKENAGTSKICWVVAVSNGRNPKDLLDPLLKIGDSVCAVEFGPVDGMPWVEPVSAQDVATAAADLVGKQGSVTVYGKDVQAAVKHAFDASDSEWTVVAGSLYLVGDVHRLLRDGEAG